MQSFFNQLFDYNFYSNKILIEKFLALKRPPKKGQELFSHMLNAHHLWNNRLSGKNSEYGVWQPHKIKDWEDIHYDNQRTTFEIITNTDDFSKRVDYKSTEGRVFGNELKDILFHIINHSTHHRGQILSNLKENGIEPPELDYIYYKR